VILCIELLLFVLCLWDWGRRGPNEGLEIIFIEEQNFFKCVGA